MDTPTPPLRARKGPHFAATSTPGLTAVPTDELLGAAVAPLLPPPAVASSGGNNSGPFGSSPEKHAWATQPSSSPLKLGLGGVAHGGMVAFGSSDTITTTGPFWSSVEFTLPPPTLHAGADTSDRVSPSRATPESSSGGAMGAGTVIVAPVAHLIPEEIPPSPLLYVLTTSEGRDKLFKTLQYLLKCAIIVLNVKDLFPSGADGFLKYWSARLASNVGTIRNGRALFKLFRWIVTLFHLVSIVDRLQKKLTSPQAPQLPPPPRRRAAAGGLLSRAVAALSTYVPRHLSLARILALSQGDVSPPTAPGDNATPQRLPRAVSGSALRSVASLREVDSAFFDDVDDDTNPRAFEGESGSSDGTSATAPTTEPASRAHPALHRLAPDDFSPTLMSLLALRTISSIVRNIIRDALFLTSKDFLDVAGAGNTHPIVARLLGSKAGIHRLQMWANRFWFVVSCVDLALNSSRLCDFAWVRPALISDSHLVCGCNRQAGPNRDGGRPLLRNKADLFFPPLDFDFGCPTTVTPKFFEAAPPDTMAMSCARCGCICQIVTRHRTAAQSVQPQWQVMLVPWLIRKGYSLVWVLKTHANLSHTCMLQLKYLCDVALSYGYCFGDYEPAQEAQDRDVGQHLHVMGSFCGLTSAIIALWRVYVSGTS